MPVGQILVGILLRVFNRRKLFVSIVSIPYRYSIIAQTSKEWVYQHETFLRQFFTGNVIKKTAKYFFSA